jgi:hypothetical protein
VVDATSQKFTCISSSLKRSAGEITIRHPSLPFLPNYPNVIVISNVKNTIIAATGYFVVSPFGAPTSAILDHSQNPSFYLR